MTSAHIHHAVPKNLLIEPGTEFISDGRLQTAFFISAAAHIFVILAIGFAVPKIFNAATVDNTLDVVIVTQSNNIENEEAKVAAQTSNVGGGESDQTASTPIPWKAINPSDKEQLAFDSSSPITVETVSEEMLAMIGEAEIEKSEESKPTEKEKQQKQQEQEKTLKQIRLEKQRIAARYEKRWSDFQKRPKREYLSPDTVQSDTAAYQVELIEKINRVGNSNFPDEIRNRKLSGILIADLALNRNGTVNSIKVRKSSGNALLDETAVRFIRLASPFKPFTNSMIKQDTDIIHITRSYVFTPKSVKIEVVDN